MDSNGVYKEINRQVLRAVIFCCSSREAPKFSDIMEFVSFYNRDSELKYNLKEMVRKSLGNLVSVGAIEVDKKSRRYFSNNIDYMDVVNIEFILDTNRPKVLKRLKSDDIIYQTRKRQKVNKKLVRKGKKVLLPKSRHEQCQVLELYNNQNYGKTLKMASNFLPIAASCSSDGHLANKCNQAFGPLGPNTSFPNLSTVKNSQSVNNLY